MNLGENMFNHNMDVLLFSIVLIFNNLNGFRRTPVFAFILFSWHSTEHSDYFNERVTS